LIQSPWKISRPPSAWHFLEEFQMVGASTNDGGLPNQGWQRWLTLQHDHREQEVAPVFEDFSSPRFMVLGETRSVRGWEDGGA
jgi:hypothetical protein